MERPLAQSHIAVEGAIGVGKTTLARALADRLGATPLLEDVDDNPFIELFYQDPERHSLAVQLSFLFARRRQWQAAHQQELFRQGMVSDFIPAKDRLFATITLSDEALALYDQVARLVADTAPAPDLVIYLQSTPEVIMQRIQRRNRPMERGLTPDYLRRVMTAYDRFFFHYDEAPLLVVQTDRLNFADNDADIDALLERIRAMRSRTEFWADLSRT
ncbi:MAG: deoxynucleoside kinase [Mariprofundaceae bacterium]